MSPYMTYLPYLPYPRETRELNPRVYRVPLDRGSEGSRNKINEVMAENYVCSRKHILLSIYLYDSLGSQT